VSFLKRLGALFEPPPDRNSLYYYVRCARCGEVIRARVDLRNELSMEYGDDERPAGYYYRKVLIGRGRCFQAIEVSMTFDPQRRVTSRQIDGGQFVTQEEYERAANG